MRRRKLPSSSKKSVNPVVAPAFARRDEPPALDEGEPPEPAPADAPTAPVLAAIGAPPFIDAASEMTRPMIAEAVEPLLAPDAIAPGDPDAPAPPPGRASPGDCRSLRRVQPGIPGAFALVYRHGTTLVSRKGPIGCAGEWRTVTYPTSWAASSAYAREVAWLVADGYADVA